MEEVDEVELTVQRVAALDLGKATLEACMRVPHPGKPGRRMQEIRGYATTTAVLLEMAIWLRQWGIERVVMESTGDYWKGVYYLLEAEGFDCWLVNAREVYHLLSDADLAFCELGPAHYESRINKQRRARDLATQLQALTGQHIVIRDGKAIITDAAA